MLETLGGQKRNKTAPDRGQLTRPDAEAHTGIRNQQVSKWRNRLKDAAQYREMLYGAAYAKAMAEANNATMQSLDNEWYTPKKYIEAASDMLCGRPLVTGWTT